RPRVISVIPDASTTSEYPIDGPRDADGEAAHAPRQRLPVIGLHQQMEVIVLDGVLNDPEAGMGPRSQGRADDREHAASPQAADRRVGPQGDVDRVKGSVVRAGAMGHSGPPPGRRVSPRTLASTAPGRGRGEDQLELPSRHLDWAIITF